MSPRTVYFYVLCRGLIAVTLIIEVIRRLQKLVHRVKFITAIIQTIQSPAVICVKDSFTSQAVGSSAMPIV